MRLSLGILAVLLGVLNASAQRKAVIGLDIAETFRSGNVKVTAGYGFHEKWSVRYDTSISTHPMRREANPEYVNHSGEFEPSKVREAPALSSRVSLQYWPILTFRGIYTEVGCRYGRHDMPCCVVGIGYSMPIWKGLSAVLSYSTDIGQAYKDTKEKKGCISMEICWKFENR